MSIRPGPTRTCDEQSFFCIDATDAIGKDGVRALNDVLRMLSIQFTVQMLMYFNDPKCSTFFTADFVLLTLYVVMGVLVYWLILRRLVQWK